MSLVAVAVAVAALALDGGEERWRLRRLGHDDDRRLEFRSSGCRCRRRQAHGDAPVAITEPVPLYLTDAAGPLNRTPEGFSEAIEQGTDVPPIMLADTVALLTAKQVAALIHNEQTSSPETEKVLSAAQAAGVPVVPVTETCRRARAT